MDSVRASSLRLPGVPVEELAIWGGEEGLGQRAIGAVPIVPLNPRFPAWRSRVPKADGYGSPTQRLRAPAKRRRR